MIAAICFTKYRRRILRFEVLNANALKLRESLQTDTTQLNHQAKFAAFNGFILFSELFSETIGTLSFLTQESRFSRKR